MFHEIRDITDGLSVFNDYQGTCNGERTYQFNESWKIFNQWSHPNKYSKTWSSENHHKSGNVFNQTSNFNTHQNNHIIEKTNRV